jgi:microcystin-dependent protein
MLNTHIRDQLNALFPIGAYLLRAANYTTIETAVEGRWLQCNGAWVSRTTYADLFSYLNGLTPALPFGSGDGSTSFTLPDLRGRIPVAEGEHATVDVMGEAEGELIADRTPQHHHTTALEARSSAGAGGTYITAAGSDVPNYTAQGVNVGNNIGPTDTPAFQVAGSWFIKFTT